MRSILRALFVLSLLTAELCFADANIIVDGQPPDWAGVTTCYNEAQGDGTGNIDLVQICITNNNSVGDVGSLYALFTNKSASITEAQFGITIDRNADGIIDSRDEFWEVNVPSGGNDPQTIYVRDPITDAIKRQYNRGSCGGTADSDGWSAHRNGSDKYVELGIAYGCLGLSYGNDNVLMEAGAGFNQDMSYAAYYDGTANTLTTAGPPPNVSLFTVASGPGKNVVAWSNPTQHEGVLILRAVGAAVSGTPVDHTQYAVGASLGNATVVYMDGVGSASAAQAFTDLNVSPPSASGPTRYYYKVFNHWQHQTFAPGNVPTASGLFGEPTYVTRPSGSNAPLWCYSTGFSSFVQPTHRRGLSVFGAGNLAAVMGSITATADQTTDGTERFRPRQLSGAVQDRFTVTTSGGFNGIFTGDQSGRVYALSSDTGAPLWTANGGAALASSIQSTPVFQARAFSDATFQAAFPSDVVFVASRNASATSNRVFALRTDTGQLLWTGPKDPSTGALVNLDIVSGAPWVEYDSTGKNRLWVGARNNGGAQPSLYVLNTLNGTVLKTFNLNGVDLPVFKDNTLNQMLAVDNGGTVHAYDLNTLNQVWTLSLGGAPASFPYTVGGGFLITRKRTGSDSGQLQRYSATASGATLMWSAPVADPSYPTIDFTPGAQRIYVGSSDGTVRSFDPTTGALLKTLSVSTQQVGTPGIDPVALRLHVFAADGRLCAYQLPLN